LLTNILLLAVSETSVAVAAVIVSFLMAFTVGRSIVSGTPLVRTLLAMVPPATERTTQVPATCVPGMSKKPNLAMNAVHCAPLKLGVRLQD